MDIFVRSASIIAIAAAVASCTSTGDLSREDLGQMEAAIATAATTLDQPEQHGVYMAAPIKLAADIKDRLDKYDAAKWVIRCERVSESFSFMAGENGRAQRGIELKIGPDGRCVCQYDGQPSFSIDFVSGSFGVTPGGRTFVAEGTRAILNGKTYAFSGNVWATATASGAR